MERLKLFFRYLGGLNYHKGIDKPTAYQYIIGWRIGFETAWKLSKILNQ